ncbi:MAG: ATP-dependent nuclease subunit B [Firmicutes bacterium HGW-Firmicutes-16]|nr:MAG: ATP-dependent nuclease subunit B [Firmicutes bacterium HGW-Firmicutes-16]
MLKLILGTAGSGKTSLITNEIRKKVMLQEGGIFMLVPEQYSHEAERELCSVCGDNLSLYAEVLSFSRMAVRVFQETGTGGKTPLDKGGRLLCMSLALNEISTRLKLYSSARNRAELSASLLQTVTELKAACISSDDLIKAAQRAGVGLSEKLYDLALCLDAYDAVLAQGRADPADRLLRLAETIGQSSVGSSGPIYIDGFTDFTGAELLVIKELLRKNADLTLCLTCDGLYGDYEHFEPSRNAANTLVRLAKDFGIETEIVSPEAAPIKAAPLLFLDEKLYSYTSETRENTNNCISVVKADSLRSECEMAAAKCLELVRDKLCRFRDIAIAVRGFDSYSAALEEAFRFYKVPLFTARRGSILQKPVAALVSDAFEVILGSWEADAVLSYMKTGLTGIAQEDRDVLETYVTMWDIRGSMWTRKKPWSLHPDGFGMEPTDESTELLARIDAIRRVLSAPLAVLSENGKKAQTATEQAKALSDFLAALRLPETLENKAKELEASDRSLLAAEYAQLWEIVRSSLEQTAAILGDTPMTQEQFSKLFLQTLSQYDVSAIPVSLDRVSAGDMDRMRRRNIKHLIILGASDDRIPLLKQGSGILSDEERDELNGIGLSLGGGTDELSRELSLIYNCVTLPSETLTLSYCGQSENGAQARPSFLIARAKLLFGLEEKALELNKTRLAAPEPAFLLAVNGAEDESSLLAYSYFSGTDEGKLKLSELREKAGQKRGKLSESTVKALYGEKLSLSPSRTDAYSACRFSYFLRYGLKLEESERAGFEAPELGTFMHYVLENVAGEISKGSGFKSVSPEETDALVDKYTDLYIAERLGGFDDKSPRFVYLFGRLRPSVRRVVKDMVRELSRSDFAPLDFELGLGAGGELPPVRIEDGNNELYINGIADRVDGCLRDGKLYLRIIDYKTGKKSFSLSDIWYGMGMQMLLYLFALEQEGEKRYGAPIIPAGVLYVPARDSIISASGDLTDEELEALKAKNRKRSGLILDDSSIISAMENSESPEYIPVTVKKDGTLSSDSLAKGEQFKTLHAHVDKRLLELSENLSGGKIEASPYYRGEADNACLYCPYGAVCRFDENNDKIRYLSKLKPSDFWGRLEVEK